MHTDTFNEWVVRELTHSVFTQRSLTVPSGLSSFIVGGVLVRMIRLHVGARFDFDHLRTSHRPGPVYEELAGLAEAILTCNTVSFCLCAPSKLPE